MGQPLGPENDREEVGGGVLAAQCLLPGDGLEEEKELVPQTIRWGDGVMASLSPWHTKRNSYTHCLGCPWGPLGGKLKESGISKRLSGFLGRPQKVHFDESLQCFPNFSHFCLLIKCTSVYLIFFK